MWDPNPGGVVDTATLPPTEQRSVSSTPFLVFSIPRSFASLLWLATWLITHWHGQVSLLSCLVLDVFWSKSMLMAISLMLPWWSFAVYIFEEIFQCRHCDLSLGIERPITKATLILAKKNWPNTFELSARPTRQHSWVACSTVPRRHGWEVPCMVASISISSPWEGCDPAAPCYDSTPVASLALGSWFGSIIDINYSLESCMMQMGIKGNRGAEQRKIGEKSHLVLITASNTSCKDERLCLSWRTFHVVSEQDSMAIQINMLVV